MAWRITFQHWYCEVTKPKLVTFFVVVHSQSGKDDVTFGPDYNQRHSLTFKKVSQVWSRTRKFSFPSEFWLKLYSIFAAYFYFDIYDWGFNPFCRYWERKSSVYNLISNPIGVATIECYLHFHLKNEPIVTTGFIHHVNCLLAWNRLVWDRNVISFKLSNPRSWSQ